MPFFVAVSPFRQPHKEIIMDDDVIDVSSMSQKKARERLRQLSELASCPCNTCRAICDRYDVIDKCEAYQLWYDERMKSRWERLTGKQL